MARNVLVVDDSVSMRTLVVGTLVKSGFTATEASNGSEALDRVTSMPQVDLVITDLNMPVMDGLVFIEKLRQRAALKHVPVLLLTTESRADKKQHAKSIGATGWLTKPFDPGQLLAVIKRVLP